MNEGLKKNESWIEIIVCGHYWPVWFLVIMDWWSLSASTGVKNGWCCHQLFNVLPQNLIFRPKTFVCESSQVVNLVILPQANIFILDWLHALTQIFQGILQFFLWFSIRISLWTNVAFATKVEIELEFKWWRSVIKVNITVFYSRYSKLCFHPKLFRCYIYNIPLFETSLLLHYDS